MDIAKFFQPSTIAIIGASDHEAKVGGILMKKAILSDCKVIPVNPNHDSLLGIQCYRTLNEYKEKIDLAVIAIPAPFVAKALEECGKNKIKNVIVISAGFAEAGNNAGEEELIEIANKYDIRFLGPNCFGVFSPDKKIDTTFSRTTPEKGNIAFISQSGALWSYISDFAVGSFGFSGFVSLGNMANLEFSDFIDYFSKDKNTKSIVLYIEKLKDGKKFIDVCKKTGKKIYAVKAGTSVAGTKAAISHTASIATDYEIYKGAFKQAGIILCDSLLDAFGKASGKKLIAKSKKKTKIGKKVIIITNAGGAGALMSDYVSEKGINVVKDSDILGTALAENYKIALESVKNEACDSIIVILTAQSMSEIEKTANVIVEFKSQTKKQLVAVFLGKNSLMDVNNIFEQNEIPYFNTLEEARASISS